MVKYGTETKAETYVDGRLVRTVEIFTEKVPVKNQTDVIREIIKHYKNYTDNDLHNIEFKLIEKDDKPQFIEKSYSIIRLT